MSTYRNLFLFLLGVFTICFAFGILVALYSAGALQRIDSFQTLPTS